MSETKSFLSRKVIIGLAVAGVLAVAGAGVVVAKMNLSGEKARACGGGWWPEIQIDYRVQGIARAEKQLAAGKYHASAGSVIRMIPHIKNYRVAQSDLIINRSLRVLAVSMTRTRGDLTKISKELPQELRESFVGASEEDRKANLVWSVGALKMLLDKKKDNPALKTELAEAMTLVPEHRDEAKKILEELAKKDLLGTAEGYRALAELRAASNDEEGRTAALDRCKKMAKDAAICVAPATQSAGSS